MTTTMNSRLSWAGDILLLNTFRPLLTEEGAAKFRRSLWLAGLQGTLEGVGLFAVIPTITAFVEGGSSMGLTWQGWVWVLAALAVAGAVVTYFQSTIGYLAAMDVMGKLSVRIGDQVASLNWDGSARVSSAACPAFSFRDSCTWARGWHISPPHSCAVPRPPSS